MNLQLRYREEEVIVKFIIKGGLGVKGFFVEI